MAFNAGSIEATLTLNRNPFTEGLKAARAQAKNWSRDKIEATITPVLSQSGLTRIQQQLSRVVGKAMINPRLDQERMKAVKAQIERQVGNINVRPRLEAGAAAALRERINKLSGSMKVKTQLDPESFVKLLMRIRTTRVTMPVSLSLNRESLAELRARVKALSFTSDMSLNIDTAQSLAVLARQLADIDRQSQKASRSVEDFGHHAHGAFSRANGAMRIFIGGMPLILPVLGAAIVGAIGLIGSLVSILTVAAAGAAAFGLVAVPVFTKIKDAAKLTREEIAKLPPGIREGANALKSLTEEYQKLVQRTERNVGLALAAGFNAATAAIKTLDPVIIAMSTALQRVGEDMTRYFSSDHWLSFVRFLSNEMLPVWMSLWDIVKYLARSVMDLTVAFMPMGQWLLKAIASGMKDFSQWASTLAKDPKFHQWVEMAKEALSAFWYTLVEVIKFLFNLATALAPIGIAVFKFLGLIFEGLNKLPPEWLAAIAMGISAIFAAMMLGATPQVALAIAGVVALATAFTSLHDSSKPLRDMIDRIWTDMQTRFIPVFQALWQEIQNKVMPAVRDLKDFFEQEFVPAFEKFYFAVAPIFEWLMRVIGTELVDTFRAAILVISGLLQTLTGVLQVVSGVLTGDWSLMWEGLKNIGEGILNSIVGIFGFKMSEIVHYFQNDFGPQFKTQWEGTWNTLSTWWNDYFIVPMKTNWQIFLDGLNTVLGVEKGTVETKWAEFWDAVSRKAIEVWDGLKTTWDEFWNGPGSIGSVLSGGTPGIVTEWNAFWDGVNTKFNEIVDGIGTAWHEFWTGLLTGLGIDAGPVLEGWNKWWDDLGTGANDELDKIGTAWNEFWGAIGTWFATESAKLGAQWTAFWDGVGTKAKQIWDDLSVWWNDFWRSNISPTLQAEIDAFVTKWNEFWDGIFTKATQIWNDLKTWWNEFWGSQQATQDAGQAQSEQSWGDFWGNLGFTIGNWIREQINAWVGFWGGIRTEQDGKQTEVKGSWNEFWGSVEATAKDIWGRITGGWNGFLSGLETATRDAVAKIGAAFRTVGNMFRDPINWVIRVVINDGILAAWNTVMGWVGAPGIAGRVGELPSFAQGGKVRGPGSGTSDSILAMVSNDEYIVPAAVARRHFHFLEALRSGQTEAVLAAGGRNDPNPYPSFAGGGQVDSGLNFARSQVGKPYSWGGVGPMGYDCSGLISAITNVMLGKYPHSRLGSTGSAPWPGWNPGLTSQFGVGYSKGNPGHMAGTLGGVNVESSGGIGVRVGNGRGATNGMFSGHMSLPQVGGQFVGGADSAPVSWWSIIGAQVEALFKALIPGSIPGANGPVGAGILAMPAKMIENVIDGARAKLEKMMTSAISTIGNIVDVVGNVASNPVGAALNSFDNGGILTPGMTGAFNGTGKPEAVLTDEQWKAISKQNSVSPIAFDSSSASNTDIGKLAGTMEEVRDLLERRGAGATVNINGATGNPTENARSAVLALRLR
jgi:phage-related protein